MQIVALSRAPFGSEARCSFHAVAMPPVVRKAQVGSLSLGLWFGSFGSKSNSKSTFLFIRFSLLLIRKTEIYTLG